MNSSLEHSAFKLFEKVCQTHPMTVNILFSPYSVQQALSFLSTTTTDETFQKEVSPYISSNLLNEPLLNTKSDMLILLNEESNLYCTPTKIDLFSSPEFGSYIKNKMIDFYSSSEESEDGIQQKAEEFQRKYLGEVLIEPSPFRSDFFYWALQYSAKWQITFDKNNTQPRPFYLEGGEEIQPETMETEIFGAYGCVTEDYEVAALPGKNQSIVYFVKPKKRRKGIRALWDIFKHLLPIIPVKAQKKVFRPLWDISTHDTKKVLQHLQDICNHDHELHHTILFQMPKLSIIGDAVTPMREFNSPLEPVLVPSGGKRSVSDVISEFFDVPFIIEKKFFADKMLGRPVIALEHMCQRAHLYLDEMKMDSKVCTAFETSLSFRTSMNRPDFVPLQPLIIKMDSPYFIVIKDKTLAGDTRIVFTAWICNPQH